MALQMPAEPLSQNRPLLGHTPSSAVMNHSRRAICLYEAATESACRQYRAVRWFLLPEAELAAAGLQAADCKSAETTSASLLRMKSARSTEFPLRRLAIRGCERTMSGAKRRAPMRSSGDRISGAAECQGDCGAIEPTKPPTGMKWRLSIFEVALA